MIQNGIPNPSLIRENSRNIRIKHTISRYLSKILYLLETI